MNKIVRMIVCVVSKGTHKIIVEPIKKCMLGKHGKNIHIGHKLMGNLENIVCGDNVSFGGENLFLSSNAIMLCLARGLQLLRVTIELMWLENR